MIDLFLSLSFSFYVYMSEESTVLTTITPVSPAEWGAQEGLVDQIVLYQSNSKYNSQKCRPMHHMQFIRYVNISPIW